MHIRTALVSFVVVATACSAPVSEETDASTPPPADSGEQLPPADTGVVGMDVQEAIDAGHPDAMVEDTGAILDTGVEEICNPPTAIERGEACGALTEVLSSYLQRCHATLTSSEASALAATVCEVEEGPLTDPLANFNPQLAGQCFCDLRELPCGSDNPLAEVATCAAVVTGTITEDNTCNHYHRCEPGLFCDTEPEVLTGRGGPVLLGRRVRLGRTECPGTCRRIAEPGDTCFSPRERIPCGPGFTCTNPGGSSSGECVPLPQLGESCNRIPCAGEVDYLFLPTATCMVTRTGTSACVPYSDVGESCRDVSCHPLFTCGKDGLCAQRPALGQACFRSPDVEMPNPGQSLQLLESSRRGCQLATTLFPSAGSLCVQTGTTTGAGTCTALPDLGEQCGIGRGLSPVCKPGSFCPMIDSDFDEISTMCVALLSDGERCEPDRPEALGPQCESGECSFAGKRPECFSFDICDERPR